MTLATGLSGLRERSVEAGGARLRVFCGGAPLRVIAGCGHLPIVERPQAVADAVRGASSASFRVGDEITVGIPRGCWGWAR